MGGGDIYADVETKATRWQRTGDLRVARNASHIGRPERLQESWRCFETGEIEWRDIPVVEVSN